MDEKVLNELINRVEESAYYYAIHKNDAWEKQLKKDKQALITSFKEERRKVYKKGFAMGKFECASELVNSEGNIRDLIVKWASY